MLGPGEVASLFGVNRRTPTDWANAGLLPCEQTKGGRRRLREDVVMAMRNGQPVDGVTHDSTNKLAQGEDD